MNKKRDPVPLSHMDLLLNNHRYKTLYENSKKLRIFENIAFICMIMIVGIAIWSIYAVILNFTTDNYFLLVYGFIMISLTILCLIIKIVCRNKRKEIYKRMHTILLSQYRKS